MTKTPILLAVLLCSSIASVAEAQVLRDRGEKASDRQALRQDVQEGRDDWRDAARLEALLSRFDAARARGDQAALLAIDAEVRRLLAGEVAESRVEYVKDRGEMRQDQRELASDRRELGRDHAAGRGPGVKADDVRDRNDDRRDLRDDRRDARAEARHVFRIAEIDSELGRLSGRADARSLDRKRVLLAELVGLARQELRQDRREAGEDVRELREDRRELREDVRQK